MKLDTSHMRYLGKSEFRTLTAVEMGSKNHEIVPTTLILSISGLRNNAVLQKSISALAKIKLIQRVRNAKYDGYRLTYMGYDYLALKAMVNRDSIAGLGQQIGVGKESDIYAVATESGDQLCLKIHRLGRISFRTVKTQRDYLRQGQSASWMYLSRLSAQREWEFMTVLHRAGFSVPTPVDTSRHQIVMELVDGVCLRKLVELDDPLRLYGVLMDFIARLANHGIIHCDFNEFNIMVCPYNPERPEREAVIIDFPQCVSIEHPNAQEFFERDVDCIRHFFKSKFDVEGDYPKWQDVKRTDKLDVEAAASGTIKDRKQIRALDAYLEKMREATGEDAQYEDESAEEQDEENVELSDGEGVAFDDGEETYPESCRTEGSEESDSGNPPTSISNR